MSWSQGSGYALLVVQTAWGLCFDTQGTFDYDPLEKWYYTIEDGGLGCLFAKNYQAGDQVRMESIKGPYGYYRRPTRVPLKLFPDIDYGDDT